METNLYVCRNWRGKTGTGGLLATPSTPILNMVNCCNTTNIEISTCDFYFNNNIPKQSNNDIHVSIFLGPETLFKKENLVKVFSCEFQENFKNTLFIEWKWKLKKASFSQRFYILVQVYLLSMLRTRALETVQSCIS